MCAGLQNSVNLGETVPSVCSETGLTVCAVGSEVIDLRVEEALHVREEEEEVHLASVSPPVKAADKVCYVRNIVVLTVVQACTVASAFWQCVVWCLGESVVKTEVVCCFEGLVPTHEIKHNNM